MAKRNNWNDEEESRPSKRMDEISNNRISKRFIIECEEFVGDEVNYEERDAVFNLLESYDI